MYPDILPAVYPFFPDCATIIHHAEDSIKKPARI